MNEDIRKQFEAFIFSEQGCYLNYQINCAEMSANRFAWCVWQAAIAHTNNTAEPYAVEAGFSNGDGTYSVRIEKLPLPKYMQKHNDLSKHEKTLFTSPPSLSKQSKIDELEDKLVNFKFLLQHSSCIDCDGSGVIRLGKGDIEQCRWCYERNEALAIQPQEKG